MIGTIKWFNAKKGYGFITPDSGGEDIFLHITSVKAAGIFVDEGTKVDFDVVERNGKKEAGKIKLAQ